MKPTCLVGGTRYTAAPYMALTGTSMATPVVTGTVALMLQANPALTPNLVKAILEYTAQTYPGYKPLEEGAGFLNALGAVRLAAFYRTAPKGARVPVEPIWSQQFIWGNHRITGGIMLPTANAWNQNIVWGTAQTADDDNIVWGTACGNDDCGNNIVWGTAGDRNIVWGTADDDNIVWGTASNANIVWGTSIEADTIVWGTADDDNIIWGTACGGGRLQEHRGARRTTKYRVGHRGRRQHRLGHQRRRHHRLERGGRRQHRVGHGGRRQHRLGIADDDNIVWGTADDDNIVWGTALRRRHTKPSVLPVLPNPPFQWFLNTTHDAKWMKQEFGDTFLVRPSGR